MSRPLCFLFCVAAIAADARAQDVAGSVQGRVLSAGERPVAGAEVIASGPSMPRPRTVRTDERGLFRLAAVPVGVEARRSPGCEAAQGEKGR